MVTYAEAQRTIEGYKVQVQVFEAVIAKIDIDIKKVTNYDEYVRLDEKRSLLINESLAMVECSLRILAQIP